jgi:hypothetical protein
LIFRFTTHYGLFQFDTPRDFGLSGRQRQVSDSPPPAARQKPFYNFTAPNDAGAEADEEEQQEESLEPSGPISRGMKSPVKKGAKYNTMPSSDMESSSPPPEEDVPAQVTTSAKAMSAEDARMEELMRIKRRQAPDRNVKRTRRF